MKKIPVWIDCDTGIDDALALLVANKLENLEIVGISTVSGNVHLSKTTPNTLKICELMGKDYPVYPETKSQGLFHQIHKQVTFC